MTKSMEGRFGGFNGVYADVQDIELSMLDDDNHRVPVSAKELSARGLGHLVFGPTVETPHEPPPRREYGAPDTSVFLG
jgi:hypothetical protein